MVQQSQENLPDAERVHRPLWRSESPFLKSLQTTNMDVALTLKYRNIKTA